MKQTHSRLVLLPLEHPHLQFPLLSYQVTLSLCGQETKEKFARKPKLQRGRERRNEEGESGDILTMLSFYFWPSTFGSTPSPSRQSGTAAAAVQVAGAHSFTAPRS